MAARIDHTGHPHPSTPAARALCRANGGTGDITPKADKPAGSKKAAAKPARAPALTSAKVPTPKVAPTVLHLETGKQITRQEAAAIMFGTGRKPEKAVTTKATVKAAQRSGIGAKLDQTEADKERAAARKKAQADRLARIVARNQVSPARVVPSTENIQKSLRSGDKNGPRDIWPEDFQPGMEVVDSNGVWVPMQRVSRNPSGSYAVLDSEGFPFILVPPGKKMKVRKKAPEPLAGGAIGDTYRVEFNDGKVGVRKSIRGLSPEVIAEIEAEDPTFKENFHSVKDQQDAEELASMLARMMGITSPETYRENRETIVQQFMEGSVAASVNQTGDPATRHKKWTTSDQGWRVGLMDQLIRNTDRNDGNWLVNGDDVIAIDHGLAWQPNSSNLGASRRTPGVFRGKDGFSKNFSDTSGRPKRIDLHPGDLDATKEILTALKPEFVKRGQTKWWDFSMAQVEAIRPYAKGKKRRIQ